MAPFQSAREVGRHLGRQRRFEAQSVRTRRPDDPDRHHLDLPERIDDGRPDVSQPLQDYAGVGHVDAVHVVDVRGREDLGRPDGRDEQEEVS